MQTAINNRFEIEGLHILQPDRISDMICGAFEGGSNYWAYISDNMINRIYKKTQDMQKEPFVDRLLMAVQRGLPVRIRDAEDPQTILGTLTAVSWQKGETLMLQNQPKHFADIIAENDDATTADVFLQFALMGELVYG